MYFELPVVFIDHNRITYQYGVFIFLVSLQKIKITSLIFIVMVVINQFNPFDAINKSINAQ